MKGEVGGMKGEGGLEFSFCGFDGGNSHSEKFIGFLLQAAELRCPNNAGFNE